MSRSQLLFGHTGLTITMYGMWMIVQATITGSTPGGAMVICLTNKHVGTFKITYNGHGDEIFRSNGHIFGPATNSIGI